MVFFEYLAIVFIISISLSCAFFVRWLVWLAKKSVGGGGVLVGRCKNSLVLLCISLSSSIICVSLFFIVLDWKTCLNTIDFTDLFYYSVLFALVFIPTVFFKLLAPVFLALYILYCGIFTFLFIDSYDIATENATTVISISPKNLLPMPQNWQSTQDESELFSKSIEKFNSVPFLQDSIRFISSLML